MKNVAGWGTKLATLAAANPKPDVAAIEALGLSMGSGYSFRDLLLPVTPTLHPLTHACTS